MKGKIKYFDKILKVMGHLSQLRNLLILIILTRLIFLESNHLALIAEIISSIAMLMASTVEENGDGLEV